jgi:hypothetical protein
VPVLDELGVGADGMTRALTATISRVDSAAGRLR